MPSPRFSRPIKLVSGVLLSTAVLTSCANAPVSYTSSTENAAPAPAAMEAPAAPADMAMAESGAPAPDVQPVSNPVPQVQPQLAKSADMSLVVQDVDASIDAIEAIAREYQGDTLNLNHANPVDEFSRDTAYLEIRVPQAQLDTALDALAKLGTVQTQSITAEDVSTQLVDFDARLRNLQKSEELLLKIMDRSGDMSEVLQVAQQVSAVREQIEQINAQLRSLQTRVAYSTIRVQLEGELATVPPQRTLGAQLEETWDSAIHSVGELTVDLVQLTIWLLVYTPYWLLIGGGLYWGGRSLKRAIFGRKPNPVDVAPTQAD
jgi:ACT domain-containing protein